MPFGSMMTEPSSVSQWARAGSSRVDDTVVIIEGMSMIYNAAFVFMVRPPAYK